MPILSAIVSHSVLDAANMLYSLENEAASFGLKINTAKTKSISIVNSSTTRQPRPNTIVLNGHPVEEVNQFTNLGNVFTYLKFAYLKAMSYQSCSMAQVLGK